ncbi:MAG: hypothetical protein M3439_04855 [Chloroflexota bacterium]|nr:hypothetical protein [Chloroflexota bacterium]
MQPPSSPFPLRKCRRIVGYPFDRLCKLDLDEIGDDDCGFGSEQRFAERTRRLIRTAALDNGGNDDTCVKVDDVER